LSGPPLPIRFSAKLSASVNLLMGHNTSRQLKKAFSTACALTLVSPEAGEKVRKEASFYARC
jgi:hypothetical protein